MTRFLNSFPILLSLIFLLFTSFLTPFSNADNNALVSNVLKDARLIEFKDDSFVFLCNDGCLVTIKKNQVTDFHSSNSFQVNTSSSESITGTISIHDGFLTVNSSTLGEVTLKISDLHKISRIKKSFESPASQDEALAVLRAKGTARQHTEHQQETEIDEQENISHDQTSEGHYKIAIDSELDAVPEDLFLRQHQVMTRKGKFELETDLTFVDNDKSLPYLVSDKTRQMMFSLTGRYGITEDLQAYVTIPFGANWRESGLATEGTDTKSVFGLGDVSLGLSYQILSESVSHPALMLSLSTKSDTGRTLDSVSGETGYLGSGYWTVSSGISMARTLDPVVLFGGINYTHAFPRTIQQEDGLTSEFNSIKYEAGDSISLLFGTGFALNNKVALTFDVNGGFVFRDKYAGDGQGSNRTPFYFRSGFDYAYSKSCYLEPKVAFGITEDASDFSISFSHVFKFN